MAKTKKTVSAAEWVRNQGWSLRDGGKRLGCSASALRLYIIGKRRWPPGVADRIESLSGRRVSFRETVLAA